MGMQVGCDVWDRAGGSSESKRWYYRVKRDLNHTKRCHHIGGGLDSGVRRHSR